MAIKAQIAGFMKRFPGIKVNFIPSTGADAASKILVETKVGNSTYEVAQATTGSSKKLLAADLVSRYDYSAAFGIPKKQVFFGNRMVPWFDLTYVLGFNTKLVSKDQVPTSWEGLLDPKWKGRKIIIVGRGYPFADLTRVWGHEKAMDFARELAKQKPIITPRGGPQILQALVAGQAPLAISQYDRLLRARDREKAPVDYVWLTPVPYIPFFAFAVKKVAHPNAAKLLAGYLGTPEASNLMEKASLRGLLDPSSKTKAAELLQKSGIKLVNPAPKLADVKEQRKRRKKNKKKKK